MVSEKETINSQVYPPFAIFIKTKLHKETKNRQESNPQPSDQVTHIDNNN